MKKIGCCLFLLVISLFSFTSLSAQKRIVVMGSSTAAGTGASSYANSWVGKTQAYFRQNMADGADTIVTNIAVGGQTTYQQMPTGFISPVPGRPAPDPNSNVTRALSYSPDIIIINLPSNDVASGFSKKEIMNNFRLLYQVVAAANVSCFITTTQPRDLSTALKDSLRTLVDSINNNFGFNAIDFWTDIATTDGLNNLKPEVNAGDGIHVNDLGHNYLFLRVRNKNIFAAFFPLPVQLLAFNARPENEMVVLHWRTATEGPGTIYEVQKKTGMSNDFQTVYTKTGNSTGQVTDYEWTDQFPAQGQNLYRLKMTEPGKISYSGTKSISFKPKNLSVSRFFIENSSLLTAVINSKKEQEVVTEIISSGGTVVVKQIQYLKNATHQLQLPIAALPAGHYFFSVKDASAIYFVKPFIK